MAELRVNTDELRKASGDVARGLPACDDLTPTLAPKGDLGHSTVCGAAREFGVAWGAALPTLIGEARTFAQLLSVVAQNFDDAENGIYREFKGRSAMR